MSREKNLRNACYIVFFGFGWLYVEVGEEHPLAHYYIGLCCLSLAFGSAFGLIVDQKAGEIDVARSTIKRDEHPRLFKFLEYLCGAAVLMFFSIGLKFIFVT